MASNRPSIRNSRFAYAKTVVKKKSSIANIFHFFAFPVPHQVFFLAFPPSPLSQNFTRTLRLYCGSYSVEEEELY